MLDREAGAVSLRFTCWLHQVLGQVSCPNPFACQQHWAWARQSALKSSPGKWHLFVCSLAGTWLSSRLLACHIQPWQGGLPPTDQVEQCRSRLRKVHLPLPGDGPGA